MRFFIFLFPISFMLLSTGCVSVPKASLIPVSINQHPLYDHQWIMEAKLSIRQAGKRNTAFIRWEQDHNQLSLSLTGPIGQGLTQILSNPDQGATLIHKQERTHYKDLDKLFYDHLGWNFSVNQVKYWLTGRPSTQGKSKIEPQAQALIVKEPAIKEPFKFEQKKWHVSIDQWRKLKDFPFSAPKKITFSYPSDALEPSLTLLVVIKKWIPNPSKD